MYSNVERTRWLRVAVGTVMMLCLGTLYAWSIFRAPFGALYPSWTTADLSMNFTISMVCYSAGGFLGGKLSKKTSNTVTALAAAVLIFAGFLGVSWLSADPETAKVQLYLFYGVLSGLGGFGGLFELDCTGYKHPVLISGTDGVGTKLKIAMIMDKHDTIGIDCVAMCVNDVICAGAKPLVFLDYIACGRNIPEKIAEIVKGVAEGCVQADCSLVGGETAEHPGMMPEDEYDLAGFTVGVVDKEKILSNDTMKPGDVIIALPSTGVHSNGFSLVRKIFDIDGNPDVLHTTPAELGGKSLGEALLAPTKIYVKPVLKVLEEVDVKGISHITGGGFYENIPRSLKKGCCARIHKADVRTPALFHLMQKEGGISEHDMFNTFNMGVGMVLTVPAEQADKALEILHANGEPEAYRLGVIAEGEGVELC